MNLDTQSKQIKSKNIPLTSLILQMHRAIKLDDNEEKGSPEFIPILTEYRNATIDKEISFDKLDFSLKTNKFEATISYQNRKITAEIETQNIDIEYFQKAIRMEQDKEKYFLKNFTMEIVRKGNGFKVIITPVGVTVDPLTATALAEQLCLITKNTVFYDDLEKLALKIITVFKENPIPKELIEEVRALAFANNLNLSKTLVDAFLTALKSKGCPNIDLLRALKITLINSSPKVLNSDDLQEILETTIGRLDKITDNTNLYATLSTLGDILDVMVDVNIVQEDNIIRMERAKRDTLYDNLKKFNEKKDI